MHAVCNNHVDDKKREFNVPLPISSYVCTVNVRIVMCERKKVLWLSSFHLHI